MRSFLLLFAISLLPTLGQAQAPISLPRETHWDVEWRNPEGHFYTAELRLELQKRRWVEGTLTWTLRASPRAAEQTKLGLTGVEYIQGEYDEKSGLLVFEGVRVEDPNTILGMDKYRLTVDSTGTSITGKTSHGETWAGEFTARRRP